MKQITEDYCNKEISFILKEKGFDVPVKNYFSLNKDAILHNLDKKYGAKKNWNAFEICISRPSQSLALKWLREVHKIYINLDIHWLHFANQNGWMYVIERILDNGVDYIDSKGDENDATFFSTYEKACEAALLYVLKNLI